MVLASKVWFGALYADWIARKAVRYMAVAVLNNLTLKYGARTVISDLSLEIPEGCVGLLGPNGAGKTTLIKALLGFLRPASGGGNLLGFDIAEQGLEIRQRVGLMPESDCHIPGMNAVFLVAYAGELAGMPPNHAMRRAHEVLEYCGLGEARYRNVETYSTGMKQRLKLAQALVHGPSLVFLDEPTNGLDPDGREEMLALIRDISHGKGVNVLVSSHLLPDIERTCDYVIVLKDGAVRANGEVALLKQSAGSLVDVELREPCPAFIEAVRRRGVQVCEVSGTWCRLSVNSSSDSVGAMLFGAARDAGTQVRGFRTAKRTLEDVFMEAVK
ncbi:MAG: ABC transporter ATP-binding protein [Armatimonadota bacterium]